MSATLEIIGEERLIATLKATEKKLLRDMQREAVRMTLGTEKRAKEFAPVDTGRLRANIHSEMEATGTIGRVISDVDYAVYVHEGTRYMSGRPYMAKALRAMKSKLERSARKLL